MCLFMFMIFILIQIIFDIHINNDELLKIIWKHFKKKKRSWLSLVMCNNVKPKLIYEFFCIIFCMVVVRQLQRQFKKQLSHFQV
jgi:hypothetical protein